MEKKWSTHRGDEWWYQDYWCDIDGSYNDATRVFSIGAISVKGGQLDENRLKEILIQTAQQFSGAKIELSLSSNQLCEALLEVMGTRGDVIYDEIKSPYSKSAQIFYVSQFKKIVSPVEVVAQPNEKAWWKFW